MDDGKGEQEMHQRLDAKWVGVRLAELKGVYPGGVVKVTAGPRC